MWPEADSPAKPFVYCHFYLYTREKCSLQRLSVHGCTTSFPPCAGLHNQLPPCAGLHNQLPTLCRAAQPAAHLVQGCTTSCPPCAGLHNQLPCNTMSWLAVNRTTLYREQALSHIHVYNIIIYCIYCMWHMYSTYKWLYYCFNCC